MAILLCTVRTARHVGQATYGNPGAFFNIQDDGNLVVYRAGSQTETPDNALWAAGSNDPWNLGGPINIGDVDYSPYSGGGDINGWIVGACQAAGLPASSGWVSGFTTLCQRESSYDPNAVKTAGSNAWGRSSGMVIRCIFPAGSRSVYRTVFPIIPAGARQWRSMIRSPTSQPRAS